MPKPPSDDAESARFSELPTVRMSEPSMVPPDALRTVTTSAALDSKHRQSEWQPGMEFGGYQITGILGRGGMGIVYKALDLATRQVAVIKSVLPEAMTQPSFRKRFIREAEEWIRLGAHPHIVRAYAIVRHHALPHVAAEYVDGEDLHRRLKRGALPPAECLRIAVQIAYGMDYAHRRGLVHRDLKPGNILLDKSGMVKITDFGLSRYVGEVADSTEPEASSRPVEPAMTIGAMGTPEYMAPEMWQGESGRSVDIYAFGTLLFEMLAGRRPFNPQETDDAERLTAYCEAHTASAVPLEDLPQDVPNALREFVGICLAKDPAARPADFAAIAEALRKIGREAFAQELPAPPALEVLAARHRADQAENYIRLASIYSSRGDYDKARRLHGESLQLAVMLGDPVLQARVLYNKSITASMMHRQEEALELMEQARNLLKAAPDDSLLGSITLTQGVVHRGMGRVAEAEACYLEALTVAERCGDSGMQATIYNNLGIVYRNRGELERAEDVLRKALALREKLDDPEGKAYALANLATVVMNRGNLDEGERMLLESTAIRESIDHSWGVAQNCGTLGLLYANRENWDAATQAFHRALTLFESLKDAAGLAMAWQGLAKVARCRQQYAEAEQCLEKAMAMIRNLNYPYRLADILCERGRLRVAMGRAEEGAVDLANSLELAKGIDTPAYREARRLLEEISKR